MQFISTSIYIPHGQWLVSEGYSATSGISGISRKKKNMNSRTTDKRGRQLVERGGNAQSTVEGQKPQQCKQTTGS
jgi:hypothetical protein